MNSAVVKINTTLYQRANTSSKKLGVMKAGDVVAVNIYYHNKTWFCKLQHPRLGLGYAHYFVNGNVHISGKGVTAAIKANGGKIGNKNTGYQATKKSDKKPSNHNNKNGSYKATGRLEKAVTLRKSASSSAASVGTLPKGTIVSMSKINITTGWCYVKVPISIGTNLNGKTEGWCQYKSNTTTWIKATGTSEKGVSLSDINKKTTGAPTKNDSNNGAQEDIDAITDGVTGGDTSVFIPEDTSETRDDLADIYERFVRPSSEYTKDTAYITSVRGVYGMPYQFSSLVDPKVIGDDGKKGKFGKLFADRILAEMPILMLSPGAPSYMPNYSNSDVKSNLITEVAKAGIDGVEDLLTKIVGEEGGGKFYTFKHDYEGYFNYLNPFIKQLAIYLGIQNEEIGGKKIKNINWASYQANFIGEYASDNNSIGFYVDAESQISESFSNSTQESKFSSAVNQVNDLSREIQFLMGGVAGEEFKQLVDNNFNDAFAQIEQFTSKYVQVLPGLLTSRLKNTFDAIKVGGQLVFPEIWNDSDYGRDYDISIKLRTPDGDTLSWFMNIGVPLIHLLTFTLPRRLGDNGIQSPFLVRAYYKAFFNVNMGIITSMSISRGDKCKWNIQGLPTDIDVSLTIKDLYQSLSMESETNEMFCRNTDQLDFIANLCGINVNKPDIIRGLILNYESKKGALHNFLTFNNFLAVSQKIDNLKLSMYEKWFR